MCAIGMEGGAGRFMHRIQDVEERSAVDPRTRFTDALRNGRAEACSWCGRCRTAGPARNWEEVDARIPTAQGAGPTLHQTMC